MIIMRYSIIILLLTMATNVTWSQLVVQPTRTLVNTTQRTCGFTETDADRLYLQKTREFRESIDLTNFRPPAESLQIVAHVLVQDKNNLTDEFTVAEVDQSIADLNQHFIPVGINFERCLAVNYISEDQDYAGTGIDMYPNVPNNGVMPNIIADAYSVDGAINIFYSPFLGNFCGFASYPNGSAQDIFFMSTSDVHISDMTTPVVPCTSSGNGAVMAHEMGHFFNLAHTHNGSQVGAVVPTVNELVARPGNCGEGVGDHLCDTPADPFGLPTTVTYIDPASGWPYTTYSHYPCTDGTTCEIIDDATLTMDSKFDYCAITDINGDRYVPDTKNIMSYSFHQCWLHFSPQQIDRMRIALMDPDRTKLTDNTTDSFTCVGCPPWQNFQGGWTHGASTVIEAEVTDYILSSAPLAPDVVNPDGTITPGANVTYDAGRYICLFPGFNAEYTSNFLAIIDGCGGEFKTAASEIDVRSKFTFNIQPNPFNEQCTIVFDLMEDKAVTISVSDIMGKQITTLVNNEHQVAGKHYVNFNGSNLPAGIYYCTLIAGDQIETQKMVIAK